MQKKLTSLAVGVLVAGVVSAGAGQTAHADGDPATPTFTAGQPKSFDYATDTPASPYVDRDGSFWVQQSAALYGKDDPRYWDFFSGTSFDDATRDADVSDAVDPKNPLDKNNDTTWRCNNSPTGKESTYYQPDVDAGTGFAERNYCDLVGVWVDPDTGDWYGLVHNEFTPRPFGHSLHYDAIDYAVSSDRGHTWKIKGHVLTSPYSTTRNDTAAFPNQTYYYGDGDQRLFVDTASGYFYVYYGSRVVDKNGSWGGFMEHVARAPISQKMAPGSWQKYDDGAWRSPGVGGKESNIVSVSSTYPQGYVPASADYHPSNQGTIAEQVAAGKLLNRSDLFVMNITYNAYLGMYIGTPETDGVKPVHFYGTRDLASQRWTDLGTTPGYSTSSWYRWMVDSATATTGAITGKTLRSYCAISCSNSDGEYVDVTTDTSSPAQPVDTQKAYQISSGGKALRLLSGGVLGVGSARPTNGGNAWRFTADGDGSYRITSAGSGLALGVGTTPAQRAWGTVPKATALGSSGPTVGQQWWVVSLAGGRDVRLVNRYSGLMLSLGDGAGGPVVTSPLRTWTSPRATADRRTAESQRLALTPVR